MKYDLPAILFAGGKSSRMGKDKALLPFGAYSSLSEFQYKKLQTLFTEVYISAKEDKFDFSVSLILDRYPQSSPLVGIISIFESLQADEIFILSVDAPFVDSTIIHTLIEQKGTADAIIARSPNGVEPLCGIYCRSILPLAQKHLKENNHRLTQLLQEANTTFVDFKEGSLFMNLNHPDEYKNALKIIST